jgi:copper chaperone
MARLMIGPSTQGENAMLVFQVSDMTCGRCAQRLATALASVEGTQDVVIDLGRKHVQVTGTATAGEVAAAIQEAGYTPEEVRDETLAPPPPMRGGCCGGRRRAAVNDGPAATPVSTSCCG